MIAKWLSLAAILVLGVFTVGVVLIHAFRPRFAYSWLVAAIGSLVAWPLIIFANSAIEQNIPLLDWSATQLVTTSPQLILDAISWPYSLALGSLLLAMIFTEVVRATEADWAAWAGSLALTALGLLAVLAGNPLTLVIAWSAIDLMDLLIHLWHVTDSQVRERIVVAYSARVGGTFLLLFASVRSVSLGVPLSFSTIPGEVSIYLLFAAGLRLGVLPLHMPFLREPPLRRGLGTLVRLIPASASAVLLSRTAQAGVPESYLPWLLILAAFAGLYAGIAWINAENELDGRPYWVLGIGALAFSAAAAGKPEATTSWGITGLISGGVLFLYSARHRLFDWLPWLGLVGLIGLPFTLTWPGLTMYAPPFRLSLLPMTLVHATLLAGFYLHLRRKGPRLEKAERWVWIIYPWGLGLLPLTHFALYWFIPRPVTDPFNFGALAFLALTGLWLVGLYYYQQRGYQLRPGARKTLQAIISLNWFYRWLWSIYRLSGRVIRFVNQVLEGSGGVLWSWLLLALFIAFLVQRAVR